VTVKGLRETSLEEAKRIRSTYAERDSRLANRDVYSLTNKAYLFTYQQRQRALLRALEREGLWPLDNKKILEVGCGTGGVLQEFLGLGAMPSGLHGTDLLEDRLQIARVHGPHLALNCSDGGFLPYPPETFDLVLQFTVFSSILDQRVCYTVSQEMVRVLKPGGLILWYDFWLNPMNMQTHGIRPATIRRYFPNSRLTFERVTLAPPIARRLVPITWIGSMLLERISIFNTHYLATIRPGS
jgi:ubiquinone/menaquinone biosynthesis C-methylase UbiE